MQPCNCKCVCVSKYVCMYVCICASVCVCMYICACVHAYKHLGEYFCLVCSHMTVCTCMHCIHMHAWHSHVCMVFTCMCGILQEKVCASLGNMTIGEVSQSLAFASNIDAIGHVGYVGVIQLIGGYEPELSCREHMLRDLPGVLQSPRGNLVRKIPFIVDECSRIAEDRLNRLAGGKGLMLRPNEALAVVSYTYDLGFYSEEDGQDNLFVALNNTLRQRSGPMMRKLKPYLSYLMRGLQALPEVHATCYRGVPSECLPVVLAKYTQGSDIHWSAFTSCTLDINTAKHFAQKGGVIFSIKILSARSEPVTCVNV